MAAIESSTRIPASAFDGAMPKPFDKTRLRRVLMIGGVLIVLAASAWFYLTGGRYISSDDSYVHANKLMVSTDVSGLIKSVNVKEGQTVKRAISCSASTRSRSRSRSTMPMPRWPRPFKTPSPTAPPIAPPSARSRRNRRR
jgi:hypothetical protein